MSKLACCLIGFEPLELPEPPFPSLCALLDTTPLTALNAAAPPNPPTNPPEAVEALSNPKNFLSIFSAGHINANTSIAYNGLSIIKFSAEPIKIAYIIK